MKKSTKRIIIIVTVIVIILAVIASLVQCGAAMKEGMDAVMGGTQVLPLAEEDLSSSINASGTVESQNVYSVTTDLTCKVKELHVALGDHVEVGDVLCVFDDTDVREQISTLEQQVSATEKLTAKQNQIAERTLLEAKDNLAAVESEANTNIANASPEMLETVKAKAEEDKKMARASVQQAQDAVDTNALTNSGNSDTAKELSKLYRQLDNMTVVAAQAGLITKMNIAQGGVANGALMQIEDNANLKVKVSIKEKDITKLQEGMKAKVASDALAGEVSQGTVGKVINFASSTATDAAGSMGAGVTGATSGSAYSAEVNVDEGSNLLLGMTVKVEITLKESGTQMAVAYDSIVTEDETSYVYRAVEQEDGTYKVEKVKVTVGDSSDYYTGVTSDELALGDLIVSVPDEVEEGAIITVSIPDEKASYLEETE